MAIDPICGMQVDEAKGLSVEHAGQTYYFCCPKCRAKFLQQQGRDEEASASCCHEPEVVGIETLDRSAAAAGKYICPMCPGVSSDHPAACPKCGMALERAQPVSPTEATVFVCPMHPEIQRDEPGTCPLCGMELEPRVPEAEGADDHELHDMTRRFYVAAALGIPLLVIAMAPMAGVPIDRWIGGINVSRWLQWLLCSPIVLWAGWPLLQRGVCSLQTMHLNMFTLIGLGVTAAYVYSTLAVWFPGWIPADFKQQGQAAVYFEAAAMIIVLVLLGQVLELRARKHTGGAIRELLALTPPRRAASRTDKSNRSLCSKFRSVICCRCCRAIRYRSMGKLKPARATSMNR